MPKLPMMKLSSERTALDIAFRGKCSAKPAVWLQFPRWDEADPSKGTQTQSSSGAVQECPY